MSYASKRRQNSGGDEGGGANWMDTYGDLVTLLLCFFVLLFAFSSMDSAKWEALVGAFTGSPVIAIQPLDPATVIERPIEVISQTEGDAQDEIKKTEEDAFFKLYENVKEFVEANNIGAVVLADYNAYIITIRFDESIFFVSGEAEILPAAEKTLDALIGFLEANNEFYSMINIEGHTDNMPISTAKYPSNWWLSMYRAGNARDYIGNVGQIDPKKISATGYGEYHPIEDNGTAEGRAANRRVDFVIQGIKTT